MLIEPHDRTLGLMPEFSKAKHPVLHCVLRYDEACGLGHSCADAPCCGKFKRKKGAESPGTPALVAIGGMIGIRGATVDGPFHKFQAQSPGRTSKTSLRAASDRR